MDSEPVAGKEKADAGIDIVKKRITIKNAEMKKVVFLITGIVFS